MAHIPLHVRELVGKLAKQAGRCEISGPSHEHGSFIASEDWVFQFAQLVANETEREIKARAVLVLHRPPSPSAWLEVDEDRLGTPIYKAAHLSTDAIQGEHRQVPCVTLEQARLWAQSASFDAAARPAVRDRTSWTPDAVRLLKA